VRRTRMLSTHVSTQRWQLADVQRSRIGALGPAGRCGAGGDGSYGYWCRA